MQLPLLHQQIILYTEKLRELHRSLMLHSGIIPATEVEQFLNEIRRLYETSLQLQQVNALTALAELERSVKEHSVSSPAAETKPVVEEKEAEPIVQHTPEPVNIPAPVEKTVQPEPVVAQNAQIPKPVVESRPLERGIKVEEKVNQVKHAGELHDRYEESPTLADRFSDSERVGDKLGKHPSKRISDQLKSPVKDLRAAIGLNEKFQFINQLFGGNPVAYNTAVDFLNNCSDSVSAHDYLHRISNENHWEKHASVAGAFIELVDRRVSA